MEETFSFPEIDLEEKWGLVKLETNLTRETPFSSQKDYTVHEIKYFAISIWQLQIKASSTIFFFYA